MTPAEILKKPYARVVVPEPDGSYRAQIVEFPGCIASGSTPAEAYASLERVAESWLQVTLEKGQGTPDPLEGAEGFSGRIVLRMPKSLHAKAAFAAKQDGVSLNQFLVGSIAEHVGASNQNAGALRYVTFGASIANKQAHGEVLALSWGRGSFSTGHLASDDSLKMIYQNIMIPVHR